jgi:hypothetical protein
MDGVVFKFPNSPSLLLDIMVSSIGIEARLAHIWTFGFIVVEPTLFREGRMDTSRPPHFDALISPTIVLEKEAIVREIVFKLPNSSPPWHHSLTDHGADYPPWTWAGPRFA